MRSAICRLDPGACSSDRASTAAAPSRNPAGQTGESQTPRAPQLARPAEQSLGSVRSALPGGCTKTGRPALLRLLVLMVNPAKVQTATAGIRRRRRKAQAQGRHGAALQQQDYQPSACRQGGKPRYVPPPNGAGNALRLCRDLFGSRTACRAVNQMAALPASVPLPGNPLTAKRANPRRQNVGTLARAAANTPRARWASQRRTWIVTPPTALL